MPETESKPKVTQPLKEKIIVVENTVPATAAPVTTPTAPVTTPTAVTLPVPAASVPTTAAVMKKEMFTYVVVTPNGEEGQFKGRHPRQAALKVASTLNGTKAQPVEIRIRQRGDKSKKTHVFKGWKESVPTPAKRPSWMPDKINKSFVSKVCIEGPVKEPEK